MYSNYNNSNTLSNPSFSNQNLSKANTVPYMNGSMNPMNGSIPYGVQNGNGDERFVGGFLGPFLLGGITGGLLAPAFSGPGYGRPVYYNNYYYPYPPYPPYYYGPYNR